MPSQSPASDGGSSELSAEGSPGTSGREHHAARSVLVCRVGHAPWQWWEDEAQQKIYHNLLTCLDEILIERGHGTTVEKFGGNLRNHEVIVAATHNGKTDDDGNSGADVLVAVALDFLVAARRFKIPDEAFPRLHMGISHGDLLHGVYNLYGWRRGRGGTGIPPYLIAGRGVAEAKVLASASGGHALRVSETVMNMLRPDHAARLCVATPAKVNGGEDMVSYRLLSEEELLDNKAAGISATSAGAVGARATQEEQDWLLRFKNPVLEEQFWLWWRRSKPALHDMTFQWLMIFMSMMVTTVQMKHNAGVPGASASRLPFKLAGFLPTLHDFFLTMVLILIGFAPDVYSRYRQPISFIFRFIRTVSIIVLQQYPIQGTVGLSSLMSRCAT